MIERKCLYCGQIIYDQKHIICPECGVDLPQEMSSEYASDGHPEPLNSTCQYNVHSSYHGNARCHHRLRHYPNLMCDPTTTVKPMGCPKIIRGE